MIKFNGILKDFPGDEVDAYEMYRDKLLTETKSGGGLKNPWMKHRTPETKSFIADLRILWAENTAQAIVGKGIFKLMLGLGEQTGLPKTR